jgi:uncharacterized protein YcaQ
MFIRSHQEHAQGSYLGSVLHASAAAVRRLAVRNQRLDGRRRASTANALLETVRALRCLQLDPTAVVARSHLLVLYSRHGAFDEALLDRLAYRDRALFEYWAHEASLVLSEDLPIHRYEMRSARRQSSARTSSSGCKRRARCARVTSTTARPPSGKPPAGTTGATSGGCWRSCGCAGRSGSRVARAPPASGT